MYDYITFIVDNFMYFLGAGFVFVLIYYNPKTGEFEDIGEHPQETALKLEAKKRVRGKGLTEDFLEIDGHSVITGDKPSVISGETMEDFFMIEKRKK